MWRKTAKKLVSQQKIRVERRLCHICGKMNKFCGNLPKYGLFHRENACGKRKKTFKISKKKEKHFIALFHWSFSTICPQAFQLFPIGFPFLKQRQSLAIQGFSGFSTFSAASTVTTTILIYLFIYPSSRFARERRRRKAIQIGCARAIAYLPRTKFYHLAHHIYAESS